jgi:hypothetical protein
MWWPSYHQTEIGAEIMDKGPVREGMRKKEQKKKKMKEKSEYSSQNDLVATVLSLKESK